MNYLDFDEYVTPPLNTTDIVYNVCVKYSHSNSIIKKNDNMLYKNKQKSCNIEKFLAGLLADLFML